MIDPYIALVLIYLAGALYTSDMAYPSIRDIDFKDEKWERIALGFVGLIWPLFWLTVAYALIVEWRNERR